MRIASGWWMLGERGLYLANTIIHQYPSVRKVQDDERN